MEQLDEVQRDLRRSMQASATAPYDWSTVRQWELRLQIDPKIVAYILAVQTSPKDADTLTPGTINRILVEHISDLLEHPPELKIGNYLDRLDHLQRSGRDAGETPSTVTPPPAARPVDPQQLTPLDPQPPPPLPQAQPEQLPRPEPAPPKRRRARPPTTFDSQRFGTERVLDPLRTSTVDWPTSDPDMGGG